VARLYLAPPGTGPRKMDVGDSRHSLDTISRVLEMELDHAAARMSGFVVRGAKAQEYLAGYHRTFCLQRDGDDSHRAGDHGKWRLRLR